MSGEQKAKQILSAGLLQAVGIATVIGITTLAVDSQLAKLDDAFDTSSETRIELVKLNTVLPQITQSVVTLRSTLSELETHVKEHEANIPAWQVWRTKIDIHIKRCQIESANCKAELQKLKDRK